MNTKPHPLRAALTARNLTLATAADQIGTSTTTLKRALRGEAIGAESRRLICTFFSKSAEELQLLAEPSSPGLSGMTLPHGYTGRLTETMSAHLLEESGCFSFGKMKTTSMILDGDGTEPYLPANIRTHYDPVPATFFEEVMQAKKQIQQEQEEKQRNGEPYQWNGEKYHISKIVLSREPVHESMMLGLWFKPRDHYVGLATRRCLDNPDFRAKYLSEDWSVPVVGFSCSMGVDITVITSDGYVLLAQRGAHQSVHQNMFNSSVSEAVSPSFDRSTSSSAPDLYRCASRGLAEELGLYESIDFFSSDILFLSCSVDTHYALYGLRGMVRVKRSVDEILQNWHRGVKDKMENKKIFPVPFTPQDVCSFVFSHERWAGGLVSLYHTLVHEFGRYEVDKMLSSFS